MKYDNLEYKDKDTIEDNKSTSTESFYSSLYSEDGERSVKEDEDSVTINVQEDLDSKEQTVKIGEIGEINNVSEDELSGSFYSLENNKIDYFTLDSVWFTLVKRFYLHLIAFSIADSNYSKKLKEKEYQVYCLMVYKCYSYKFIKSVLHRTVTIENLLKFYKIFIPANKFVIFDMLDTNGDNHLTLKEMEILFSNREVSLSFFYDLKKYNNNFDSELKYAYNHTTTVYVSRYEFDLYFNRDNFKNLAKTNQKMEYKIKNYFALQDIVGKYFENVDKKYNGYFHSDEIESALSLIGYNGLSGNDIIKLVDFQESQVVSLEKFAKIVFGFNLN